MLVLILGLVVFLGLHSVRMVAPQWREARIDTMGAGPWKGVYSVVSIIGLGLIIWGYSMARYETEVWYVTPFWMVHLVMLLMWLALVIITTGDLPTGHIKARLKHPMLVAIKLWALAHLLVNGDTASILLFGSFLVWAVFNRISVKRRPYTPPAKVSAKWDAVALVLGTVLWLLLVMWLHPILFGVEIIA